MGLEGLSLIHGYSSPRFGTKNSQVRYIRLMPIKCFKELNVQFEEDQLLDLPQSEAQEGINTLISPFDDDILSHVSDLDEEEQDQHDLDIEAIPHENLDPDPSPIPNQ